MRRALATATLALLALVPPPVHAGAGSAYEGGCGFTSATGPTGEDQAGEIHVAAVVYSTELGDDPVSATVTCSITVNGVAQPGAVRTASGTAVVAGAWAVTYPASAGDAVAICERVDYTGPGDTTPTAERCRYPVDLTVPPYWLPYLWDPLTCEALPLLAGTYGPVLVDEQGDVYVAGEPQFDCPPYDIDWGS